MDEGELLVLIACSVSINEAFIELRNVGIRGEALSEEGNSDRSSKEAEDSIFVGVKRNLVGGGSGIHETTVKSESVEWCWSSSSLILSDFGVGGGFTDSSGVASQGVGSVVQGRSWSQLLNKSTACLSGSLIG